MSTTGELKVLQEELSQTEVIAENQSSQRLFEMIYDELYKLAQDRLRHERSGHTLQPTALMHEVYLRLVSPDRMRQWANTGHFFSAAAKAMRHILIDNARKKHSQKRSIEGERVDVSSAVIAGEFDDSALLELNDALTELEKQDAVKAKLVELRFFAGLSSEQICGALNISRATEHRYWKQARAWLFLRISETRR